MVLKLGTHGYSRSILAKIVESGGQLKSFALASRMLKRLAGVSISGRHVGRITHEIGAELAEARDGQTQQWIHYRAQPREKKVPQAVAVSVDGGRIMTREEGHGPGVHHQGWREDKIACLHTLEGPTFDEDPQPQPPASFLDHRYVADLTRELKSRNGLAGKEPEESLPTGGLDSPKIDQASETAEGETVAQVKPAWPPKRLERTCVATQRDIDAFGPMVAAHAHARNFDAAPRRGFLGDGLACNWTMQAKWFKDYVPILDFIHPLAYLYLAAAAISASLPQRWDLYVKWMTVVWRGEVAQILPELEQWLAQHEPIPDGTKLAANDPRLPVAAALTYLTNNQSRMNYPQYRRQGLPITSCAVESLIKEFNSRVKGTEKFWNSPTGAETILQVRAALLSDDDRLENHLDDRPGNPFLRRRSKKESEQPTLVA